jgi:hypothetical protein
MITAYCANFAAGALSSYSSALSTAINGYPAGAILVNADGGGTWINLVNGNTTDPDTGGANWLPLSSVGNLQVALAGADVTLTPLQSAVPLVVLMGAQTANVNVIFPANTGQEWIVVNACTGSFSVTAKTAAGTGVAIPATGPIAPTSIYCDGTNIQTTGVSTAGLAPINSPALTGTPTAPTASPATTNTTQIATTAFTQSAITAALAIYAKLASPIFSGVPTAPTAAHGTNTLQLATTAFVQAAVAFSAANPLVKAGQVVGHGGSSYTYAFPVPYPTACTGVVCSSYGVQATINITAFDRFGFTVTNGASGSTTNYMAAGY